MIKQVFVVRKDLNMRKGKVTVQCSHASNEILLEDMNSNTLKWLYWNIYKIFFKKYPGKTPLAQWLNGSSTKICLQTNGGTILDIEKNFYNLRNEVEKAGIPCLIITDNSMTEFRGVPTDTVLVIGPWYSEIIDNFTGGFKLL
jgi:PTH2 family peptidyl-tRNA hydrolase